MNYSKNSSVQNDGGGILGALVNISKLTPPSPISPSPISFQALEAGVVELGDSPLLAGYFDGGVVSEAEVYLVSFGCDFGGAGVVVELADDAADLLGTGREPSCFSGAKVSQA